VKELAFSGELVFRPDLLVVDEGTLARAVKPVLEGGERDRIHGFRFEELTACTFYDLPHA